VIDAFGQPQSLLVVGGTSDIGLAVVRALVARRCRIVVLAGRHERGLEEAAEEARQAGATEVHTLRYEALDVESHEALVHRAFEVAGGSLDMVLVAVGLLGDQGLDESDPLRTSRVIGTNFTGAASVLAVVADRLRGGGAGRIVVLSSVAGVRVRRANFVYGAAKAGLDGYAQGLADALEGSGARLQIVRPGFVRDRMTKGRDPAPFATTPEAVAEAVVQGLQTGSAVVWVPPVLRWVFAVLRILPRPLWRRVPG
jgi:decaprenylphospho-beta-D-erythro-pentofuranosid-2-ulose 2-reductase